MPEKYSQNSSARSSFTSLINKKLLLAVIGGAIALSVTVFLLPSVRAQRDQRAQRSTAAEALFSPVRNVDIFKKIDFPQSPGGLLQLAEHGRADSDGHQNRRAVYGCRRGPSG